jgi:hypothetical protein
MNLMIKFGTTILGVLFLTPAMAGTQVLDAELGVTTVEQLKSVLSKNTMVQQRGVNKYSGGEMYATDGASYGIDGLDTVLYIFDNQKKLAGVIMTMDKDRFASIYDILSKKYKIVSKQRPFVGDQYALFKPSDANIEIAAPHLSFEMEVRYLRNDLVQQFNAKSEAEAAAKKKTETRKF